MILKIKTGQTDWRLIEGFKEIQYFRCEVMCGNLTIPTNIPKSYRAVGSKENFQPDRVIFTDLPNTPVIDIGIIGEMKNPNGPSKFLIENCGEAFILSDEGKTIERI
jgi:hypothetical protein